MVLTIQLPIVGIEQLVQSSCSCREFNNQSVLFKRNHSVVINWLKFYREKVTRDSQIKTHRFFISDNLWIWHYPVFNKIFYSDIIKATNELYSYKCCAYTHSSQRWLMITTVKLWLYQITTVCGILFFIPCPYSVLLCWWIYETTIECQQAAKLKA